ncbi:DUF4238 domain-containing protein [Microbacterium gorillae]|uniref:DUF4238 domain-containing protein n=1 Tax=Microbacterium gorillae TaxID=1231063 RepID=UPI003D96C738
MRDHYIPAAFLGRFSGEEGDALRERRLQVLRPGQHVSQPSRAAAIGFVNDLYDVDNIDGQMHPSGERFVDDLWDEYEPRLSTALDNLIGGTLPLVEWLEVVVPFVASLTVRDRFYGERLVNAWQNDASTSDEDSLLIELAADKSTVNQNRIMGRNRAMGKLLVSGWSLGTTQSDLCTSDLGYAYYVDTIERDGVEEVLLRLIVPISRRAFLAISPEGPSKVLSWEKGRWRRDFFSLPPQPDLALSVNSHGRRVLSGLRCWNCGGVGGCGRHPKACAHPIAYSELAGVLAVCGAIDDLERAMERAQGRCGTQPPAAACA